MDLIEIIQNYGNYLFGLLIFFGGRWGLRYFQIFKNQAQNFLVFATVFAAIFIGLEVYLKTFKAEDAVTYLLTFTVVTTVYEQVAEWFPFLKPKLPLKPGEDEKPD